MYAVKQATITSQSLSRCYDDRMDAAAHQPIGGHFNATGLDRGSQVVEDAIGHILVKGPFVAKAPQVLLETLQFNNRRTRDIADGDGGEIRLTGHGAQARE